MCQAVLPVERGAAHDAHVLPVDIVYPHVPHQLILPPEALLAADTLERPHPRVCRHVSV